MNFVIFFHVNVGKVAFILQKNYCCKILNFKNEFQYVKNIKIRKTFVITNLRLRFLMILFDNEEKTSTV